jgi:Uncharacterised protein family (UPF0093)
LLACFIYRVFLSIWRWCRTAAWPSANGCCSWRANCSVSQPFWQCRPWLGYGIGRGPGNGWMHAKLAIVLLAIGYHHVCARILGKFTRGQNTRSHVYWRWFNEAPVLLLVAAVVLVVVKPF